MSERRLPLTVIGGYLGAGKTTLINRLLSEDHGLKLLIMVNDFGAINIDAALLKSQDEDTITLTNGCVCCTMGTDLIVALGAALDRQPRPDHLVIEASGIADPASIANCAINEPDMDYAGIITMVDGLNFAEIARDEMIGVQLCGQVSQGDVILVSKCDEISRALQEVLAPLTKAQILCANNLHTIAPLLLSRSGELNEPLNTGGHLDYIRWNYSGARTMSRDAINLLMNDRPAALYRLKGFIASLENPDQFWEIHCVGKQYSITKNLEFRGETCLVAIGLKSHLSEHEMNAWWSRS